MGPLTAGLIGLAAAAAVLYFSPLRQDWTGGVPRTCLLAGLLGQTIWGTRFLVPSYSSERAGLSHFQTSFWWLTLAGSVGNIVYTAQLDSLVFLAGYVPMPIYPIRNLMLERRRRCNT